MPDWGVSLLVPRGALEPGYLEEVFEMVYIVFEMAYFVFEMVYFVFGMVHWPLFSFPLPPSPASFAPTSFPFAS